MRLFHVEIVPRAKDSSGGSPSGLRRGQFLHPYTATRSTGHKVKTNYTMSLMLLLRAKEGGRCPPSFLKEENMSNADGFESELVEVLAGANGTKGVRIVTTRKPRL